LGLRHLYDGVQVVVSGHSTVADTFAFGAGTKVDGGAVAYYRDIMCGRYRRTTSEEELARIYKISIPPQRDLPISWNIAPSQDVLVIRFNPKTGQRSLDALRWGLVPYWAKDDKIGYRTINARAESVDTALSYREAFKKRRCLIPADGFYEWKKVPGGGKIPYAIGMKDAAPFVFTGLWEGWKNPATED
jgi:putative SOS response-associated peptidase YedK